MKIRAVALAGMAAVLLLSLGCQREDPNAAVQKAIEQHLASRPNLSAGDIVLDVQQVRVEGERAQADVVFRSRSDPNAQMSYHYDLVKESGEWKVTTGRPSSETSPHPGAGEAPSGDTPLPEGHPPIPPPQEPPPAGSQPPSPPSPL